jgi:endonuclease/exonuclease/phosphatase (EEP) superfamily protein YafD
VTLLGWVAVGALLTLCATQWIGFDAWRPVAIVQSLSPFAFACAAPIAVAAALSGHWAIAIAAVVVLATLLWMVVPAVFARAPHPTIEPHLRVAFGNLLADNLQPNDVMAAMAGTGADMLVMVEFTPAMATVLERICGAEYPHRVDHARPHPGGIAVWSRHPFSAGRTVGGASDRPSIDIRLTLADTPLRLLAVHTEPPTMRARNWRRELREIADLTDERTPTMLLGDFNASRWHPSFRRLLAHGWRTAHEWTGQWWRGSWPTAGKPAPVFIRLDHALLRDGVAPTGVEDLALPGSDHRGFVLGVTVTHP